VATAQHVCFATRRNIAAAYFITASSPAMASMSARSVVGEPHKSLNY